VLVLISYVLISGISALRRFKLIVAFLLFMTIIGGGVYFVFNWLGTYFPEYMATTVQDRKLLILSVVILLAIAVIRLLFLLFFHANSEIVSQIPAASAGRTETQANVNLRDRGFMNMPITVDYKMDGTYTGKQEISTTGTEKHPIYTTTFVTTNGNIWVIMEINGDVFALPLSFNQERGNAVPIILSETETITSYDSASNQFFVTKPDESVYTVKVVERIDAETLDALTRWEVEQL